jgi:transcriptional regulator with XRE-family HTH domain
MTALHFETMHARTLGERLRHARQMRNLTQDQLAARCGVSRSVISQWETGVVQEISATHLFCTARALRVSLDWLLEGDDEIREAVTCYGGEDAELVALWRELTTSQRDALLEQLRGMAAHNRALLDELTGKR